MAKITISYRREDSMDITGRIFDRLSSHYGRESVFRDIDNIPPGIDFRQHIRASIENSGVLIVVVGPRWIGGNRRGQARIHAETDYVRIEVETALKQGIAVIPLLVGGAAMPEASALPENIKAFAYCNAVRVDSGRDFDHHIKGLIGVTDEIIGHAASTLAGAVEVPQVDGNTKTLHAPVASAPRRSLFFPLIGGAMTVIGLMHIGWFTSNLVTALSSGAVQQMFQVVWTYADMSFGLGGLIIGIGTISAAPWARSGGIGLCLLIVFSNLLWFSENIDRDLPRLILLGTGLTSLLAVLGIYLLSARWPSPAEKQ